MIVCVPFQLPGLACSVCPSCAVPEIVGGDVLAGGDDVDWTTPVAAEVELAVPSALDAVTTTRRVWPTSEPAAM